MTTNSDSAIGIASVPNFRDIAGSGYATTSGLMRRGRLFRSGAFDPTPADSTTLETFDIALVHDMRARFEIDRRPDAPPRGAAWRHNPVPGLNNDLVMSLETPAELQQSMIDHYRGFVTAPDKLDGLGSLLAAIADTNGPQVFHCSEGKDRTGWVAMVLQSLAGVSRDDIVADYLLTNEFLRVTEGTLELVRMFFGDRPDEFFMPILVADAQYLEAGMQQMVDDHGDVETYLREGLNLGNDQVVRLRAHVCDN